MKKKKEKKQMSPLPYLARFNHPALVIGIDPGLTMGIAVIRLGVIRKLIERGEKSIVGNFLFDKGLQEGMATAVFKNENKNEHIVDRIRDLMDKLNEFIFNEEKTFIYTGEYDRIPAKQLKYGEVGGKRLYTEVCRDIYIVIEVPRVFAPSHQELIYVTGALFGTFPNAIKRVITRGSTLKGEAFSMLIHRDSYPDFWAPKTFHEVDAYMAAEWFLANEIGKYY